MIIIDKNKCIGCGSCVKICHEHCLSLDKGFVRIDYDFCSTCTQCIATCPEQALSWDHMQPTAFDSKSLPTPKQMDELFKERRTIRFFKQEKVNRTLLEEIVRYGVYAPTHNFSFRVIIVDDEKIIEEFDRIIFRSSMRIYKLLFKPRFMSGLVRRLAPVYEKEFLRAKPKLEHSLEIDRAYASPPPALVFIIGDKRIPLSELSAQYALYNMNLYAQVKGIGCRNLVGNQMFLNKKKAVRARLGLKKHERIMGTFGVGYPAVRFRNKVAGRTFPVQWNEG